MLYPTRDVHVKFYEIKLLEIFFSDDLCQQQDNSYIQMFQVFFFFHLKSLGTALTLLF